MNVTAILNIQDHRDGCANEPFFEASVENILWVYHLKNLELSLTLSPLQNHAVRWNGKLTQTGQNFTIDRVATHHDVALACMAINASNVSISMNLGKLNVLPGEFLLLVKEDADNTYDQ